MPKMHINKVTVRNFRLLADAELVLEDQTTLIVGRNNSGKTSLSEAIRRFLEERNPRFHIEDFSNTSHDRFCEALDARNAGCPDDKVRALIPSIELRLLFHYDPDQTELGPLSDFIVDLDADCNEALVVARYELRDGAIEALFADQPSGNLTSDDRVAFFQKLRERVPKLFTDNIWAEDPNDATNRKPVTVAALRSLLRTGFINAQRGLDDDTSRETGVLAKVLTGLFDAAKSPTAGQEEQLIAQALQEAVSDIQATIQGDFREKLQELMPTLRNFGYPGLDGTELETETTLDVERLLSSHTMVRYAGHHGILLPESYTGLGIRNLIFILLRIVSFYRTFRAESATPGVHLVFIEEPEAHLHPQMQEVFIRQVSKIAQHLSAHEEVPLPWPVQFIVSTHSSHVANAAGFEAIRYFLPASVDGVRQTRIRDLREGLRNTPEEHRKFLRQYLTLTRCDLFFADKAVLIEGTSERLLLPVIIEKLEKAEPGEPNLSSQYVTTMEVGGAYAHIFFALLDFLELRTLIITDLDSVATDRKACPVHLGTATSNACLKSWFGDGDCSPRALLAKDDAAKVQNFRRIAFQQPEAKGGPCGRTFEDAFMLANPAMFGVEGATSEHQAQCAWDKRYDMKKSDFALKYAIDKTAWNSPRYILDGLRWLALGGNPDFGAGIDQAAADVETPGTVAVHHG
ncbi:MAG: ATP-dependent endonuclease [Candidatus Tectomicrobia bacterium]|nr:ATP-dependent endonuclease [Candidatus Tectomicrobia bacterium]